MVLSFAIGPLNAISKITFVELLDIISIVALPIGVGPVSGAVGVFVKDHV